MYTGGGVVLIIYTRELFIVLTPFLHRVLLGESHKVSGRTDSVLVPHHQELHIQLASRLSPHHLVCLAVQ